MNLWQQFLDAVSPAPGPDSPTIAEIVGAGDPIMAQVATGHDYAETVATSTELAAAETAKGRALTQAETAALLTAHPSADASLVQGQAAARALGRGLAAFFGSLWTVVKWVGVGILVLLGLAVFFRVRGK